MSRRASEEIQAARSITLFGSGDVAQRVNLSRATVCTFLRLTNPRHAPKSWHRLNEREFNQAVTQIEQFKAEQPAQPLRALKAAKVG